MAKQYSFERQGSYVIAIITEGESEQRKAWPCGKYSIMKHIANDGRVCIIESAKTANERSDSAIELAVNYSDILVPVCSDANDAVEKLAAIFSFETASESESLNGIEENTAGTNTRLDQMHDSINEIEADVDAIRLTSQSTATNTSAIDAKLGTANAYLYDISSKQTTANAYLSVGATASKQDTGNSLLTDILSAVTAFFTPALTYLLGIYNAVLGTISVSAENLIFAPYGEVEVSDSEPVVAGNAVYGFLPTNFQQFTALSGAVSISNRKVIVSSGTSLGAYAAVRSLRSINYKTGQGAIVRFSARFPAGVANCWTGCGAFNIGDELSFGYDGTVFGIWHRYGGLSEVRKLTFTNGTTLAETATVTINGTAYSIPLTAGSITSSCARQVTEYLIANASATILVDQIGADVQIMFTSDGAKSGTYSFSTSVAGTATASFSQITAGVTKTSVHKPMSQWDVPNGFSGFDPTLGNSYAINIKNGFSSIDFYLAGTNGQYIKVHTIQWANSSTSTNLINPSMRLGCYATALGTIPAVSVEMAYIAGLVTSKKASIRNPRGYSNTKSIGLTRTNILTIRNRNIYNGFANQIEIQPRLLVLTNNSTSQTARFEIRTNPTVAAGTKNFTEVGSNLVSLVDVSGTTVSADGTLLASYDVVANSNLPVNLEEQGIRIPPNLDVVISGAMLAGSATNLSASIGYYEDI